MNYLLPWTTPRPAALAASPPPAAARPVLAAPRPAATRAQWVLGAGLLLAGAPALAQTNSVPVAVTGYTADVVANGSGTAAASTTNDFDGASNVLMEKGYSGGLTAATVGLPTGGLIASATGSGATYQLASYSANNSLRGGGTLTLATPQAATTLYVLAATGSGNGSSVVTVTFTDGTTQAFAAVTVPDWFGGANYAIMGLGRINRTTSGVSNDTSNPRLYEFSFALSAANASKLIQSVAVTQSGGVLNVMGVSVAPTAIITGISPSPAGTGVPATLTGTGLSGATSLVINGAAATILTNTGTAITFRVPAGASATGTSSVTTPTNTATSTAFTYLPAPGNALAFDGTDDYVTGTAAALPQGNAARTLEAWVQTTGTGTSVIFNYGTATSNQRAGLLVLGGHLYYAGENNDLQGNLVVNDGHWHHVAATYTGTLLSLYVDGVLDVTGSPSAFSTTGTTWRLGSRILTGTSLGEQFAGRIDEVQVYNTARTAAQVKADLTSPAVVPNANLVAYYNCDEGTPATASTGANAGTTTLYDISNANNGTLTNFALASGNTTSNWVESYALVVPTATAATGAGSTGFVANWTAPALGAVATYYVDVATNATFSSGLTTQSVAAPATSLAITGLAASTTYYYRVRADKASVTGQGDYSATSVVPTCAAPLAVTQNVTLALDVNGNATLGPSAANNGSTANCGPAPASALSVSRTTFSCADLTPTTSNAALTFNTDPAQPQQFVAVGSGATVPVGNSAYTIEAWIKPTQRGNYGIIGWGGYSNNNQVNALRLSDTGLRHYWWANDLDATTADLSGAWHHVAATYDPATNTRRLYLDGAQVSTDNPSTSTPHAVPSADNLRIGSTNFGEFFPGSIDEVRVWNVARTAAQIAATRGTSIPGTTAGLVAYYRFNENGGTTTADATGAAANLGTLTRSPLWTTPGAPVSYGQPVALTVTDNQGNTSTAPLVVTVMVPAGTTATTWNGAASTDWTSCQNWSYGQVPAASISATVPVPTSGRYPSLPAGTYPVNSLSISSGASLTTSSGAELQVNGDLANSGTASLAGPVTFLGATATQTLSGSSPTAFSTLTVSKASGTVQLSQSATVGTSLLLSSGLLDTKAYQLTLGSGATIGETDASYVLGTVAATRTLAAGAAESFGGLGLTLTPTAGSAAPGSTPVVRTTGTALAGVGTSQSILRYFTITPATKTGLNVSMVFSYFAHELATSPATPEANLTLFKSETGASNSWQNQNPATLNTSAKTVTKAGITSFSVWTLGSSANPLPVELVSFTAVPQGSAVRLAWATASELRSASFEVERSLDGVAFAKVGAVAAAGTSATTRTYTLLDAALPAGASLLHYRLRQVDQDGAAHYTPVRTVALAAAGLSLYPNPTATTATLSGAAPGTPVQVLDALGRVAATATADASGTAQLPALPRGVYVVRSGSRALRLTVD
ncbi:MAG: LamG-like jellyroll fold domain-containing protein [Janthinobacterium lividum]